MSAQYTLRFNISRPVGNLDAVVTEHVATRTANVIDEHCIVAHHRGSRVSATVAQITVAFRAANDNEAQAISYDAITGGTQGHGVAVDAMTLTRGSVRITL